MTKAERIKKITDLRNAQKGLGGWHLLHLVLTLCTGLLWGIVWILHALERRSTNKKLERMAKEQELFLYNTE